jgi:DNA helicase HerA-like ATPase
VVFWDFFGEQGHPIRATIAEMGPPLLARLLDLNDTENGVLKIVFGIADEKGLLLLDLKDLRAALGFVAENASDVQTKFGNVAPTTIGATFLLWMLTELSAHLPEVGDLDKPKLVFFFDPSLNQLGPMNSVYILPSTVKCNAAPRPQGYKDIAP